MKRTPDKGTGGNGSKTHLLPHSPIFFEFFWWDKSHDRQAILTGLKVLADR
jgi:hypothetical protein